ncbi:LysE/ArgO family amino acid transporter [Conexibacter sp. CPCC 206217]|uniref:LysE/ArgO family amino acid transporter n=1 Tax=Conexibacter sp. CPCC 206217 TaxID=3064574 RepID=UPI002728BDA7|nr:LysE/ArgO family amino acid transporter [Conexibacter sp. CPCC 206217]MDO8211131.1 LysE/ArgO family amino acid transporter [Conexibacter sp. CPCC 206217]
MLSSDALLAALAGLTFGLSLIVAIGAQNAFVLRQGLLRQHRAIVVVTCAASDVALIALGVGGAGAVLATSSTLSFVARAGGAIFLISYAVIAARRALHGETLEIAERGEQHGRLAVFGTTLALTWLNPHVYLDTVLLVGTAANAHGAECWWFAAGTGAGSVVWFTALGYGAAALRPLFAKPAAWRVLDAVIATIMLALGVSLAISAF